MSLGTRPLSRGPRTCKVFPWRLRDRGFRTGRRPPSFAGVRSPPHRGISVARASGGQSVKERELRSGTPTRPSHLRSHSRVAKGHAPTFVAGGTWIEGVRRTPLSRGRGDMDMVFSEDRWRRRPAGKAEAKRGGLSRGKRAARVPAAAGRGEPSVSSLSSSKPATRSSPSAFVPIASSTQATWSPRPTQY